MFSVNLDTGIVSMQPIHKDVTNYVTLTPTLTTSRKLHALREIADQVDDTPLTTNEIYHIDVSRVEDRRKCGIPFHWLYESK